MKSEPFSYFLICLSTCLKIILLTPPSLLTLQHNCVLDNSFTSSTSLFYLKVPPYYNIFIVIGILNVY
ncbi:hypothetical protein BDF14DRAFT_716272 [Spinellus fusiger]|nr:hypothetical protein BDF14DRAFT_716272 [Spinellus fusiger]